MTIPRSADDRPDPADQHAVHARVPEHVSRGVFSTGVIVMTAPTEFVIDFIQNLGRPHQVVARVIMPHPVLPQFVDALLKNIELYRGRYGNLPQPNLSSVQVTHAAGPVVPGGATPIHPAGQEPKSGQPNVRDAHADDLATRLQTGSSSIVGAGLSPVGSAPADESDTDPSAQDESATQKAAAAKSAAGQSHAASAHPGAGQPTAGAGSPGTSAPASGGPGSGADDSLEAHAPDRTPQQPAPTINQRRASAQEIYDDLKIRDDVHSGSYANAVMIGHGPHEFSFDFITNFYPQSAVSARVFLAAGQVARLAESLRGAWDQIRHRFPPPSGGENSSRP